MTRNTALIKAHTPKDLRIGCTYCFDTLNPSDPQLEKREFIICGNCQASYHSVCWTESCLVCANDKVDTLFVLPPPSLTSKNKRPAPNAIPHPPPFKPSAFQITFAALSALFCLLFAVALGISLRVGDNLPTPTVIVASDEQSTVIPLPTSTLVPPTVTPSSLHPTRTPTQDTDDTDTPLPPIPSATRMARPSLEPSRTKSAEPPICLGAFPTRLTVGLKARIVNYQVNVRSGPGTDYSINNRLTPGRQVTILGGPHCDDGQNWYEIISDPIETANTGEVIQVQGWVVEESGEVWFLEPVP